MKTALKKTLAILAAACLLACLCACGGTPAPSSAAPAPQSAQPADAQAGDHGASSEKLNTKLFVGCSVRSFSNPYMVTISEGCEQFCAYLDSLGQEYEYEVMLNESSTDTQVEQVKAFLAKSNGNAILFCDPNEAAVCGTIAEMVTDAGAYMCTTWNKPDDIDVWDYDGWVAHHSPNDVDMGYQIAVEMFKQFETPGKGKIVCIQGLLGNTTAVNRRAGLEKSAAGVSRRGIGGGRERQLERRHRAGDHGDLAGQIR